MKNYRIRLSGIRGKLVIEEFGEPISLNVAQVTTCPVFVTRKKDNLEEVTEALTKLQPHMEPFSKYLDKHYERGEVHLTLELKTSGQWVAVFYLLWHQESQHVKLDSPIYLSSDV